MAKNNNSDNATPAAPKRAATRRSTKAAAEIANAADIARTDGPAAADAAYHPSADEIAQAAYQRYLSRGGVDGGDFDDWIEAERELTSRRSR